MADDLFADVPDAGGGLFDDVPDLKGTPGVRAALKDIVQKSKFVPKYGASDVAAENYTLGLTNLTNAGLGAVGTGIKNVASGKKPAYTAKEYFDAYRLWEDARRRAYAAEHPGRSFGAAVLGGLAMPGGEAISKWVVGKTAPALIEAGKRLPTAVRVGQGVRASGAAGVQGALQGAATARPGEEGSEAVRGGTTAALAAPALSLGARAVTAAAPVVSRTSRRAAAPVTVPLTNLTKPGSTSRALLEKYVAPPTPEAESLRKIAKVLQKQQLDPAAVEAALTEWKKAGGVTPAMIDILRDAGASQPVLRLLNESEVTAPVRAAAERQAAEAVKGVQGRALAETEKLQTGEPRAPSAIRADIEARTVPIDEDLAARQAEVARRGQTKTTTLDRRLESETAKADRQADVAIDKATFTRDLTQRDAPRAPVAQEEGAAAFADDLNAKYDESYKTYKEKFDAVENLDPETARVADDESDRIYKALLEPIKNRSDRATKEVRSYLKEFWPEDGKLTVLQLRHMEEDLNGIIQGSMDKRNADVAVSVKKALDNETNRLFTEGKIEGDPNVITLWADAKNAFIEHQKNFGKGLAKTLTERDPYQPDVRKVEPWKAADVIFGPKGTKPVNTLFSELTDALRIASPDATKALEYELYLRLADKPDELARLLSESTGGKNLLPKALAELNIATRDSNVAADEALAIATRNAEEEAAKKKASLATSFEQRSATAEMGAAQRAREAEAAAAAAKAPIAAEENALGLGEQWLAKPRDEFIPATDALPDELRPLAAAGAKGDLIARIESPGPEDAISTRFLGTRATENLGATLGPEQVAPWQAAMANIEKNARNAREVASAVEGAEEASTPLIAHTRPGDIVYPKVGATNVVIRMLRKMSHLKPEEQMALLKRLSDPAESGLDELKASLIRKYPSKSVAATPAIAKAFSAPGGDADALQLLREEYGVVD